MKMWGAKVPGVGSCMSILTFAGALEYLRARNFALCTKRTLSERSEFVLFVHAFSKISGS